MGGCWQLLQRYLNPYRDWQTNKIDARKSLVIPLASVLGEKNLSLVVTERFSPRAMDLWHYCFYNFFFLYRDSYDL